MLTNIIKTQVVKLLHETADKIDVGNCDLTESEAMDIMSVISHERLSKEDACDFVHLSRSRFDDFVRMKVFPRGRKVRGSSNLYWYKDELYKAVKDYNEKYSGNLTTEEQHSL